MTDRIEATIDEIEAILFTPGGLGLIGTKDREKFRNALLRLMATAVSPEKTLAQARAEMRDGKNTKHGMKCPCCDKHTQVYRRNISSNTINWFHGFIQKYDKLVEAHGDATAYAYVTDLKTNPNGDIQAPPGGDYAKLEWWGLMQSEGVGLREDGSPRTGRWRPTELGRKFVRNEVRVRMYIWEYMSEPIENQPSCEMILLQDIEDVNFDFRSILHPANCSVG